MTKALLLLASLGLTTSYANAQPGKSTAATAAPCASYSGHVMSGEKPVSGANLAVKGTTTLLITNEEGYFTLAATGADAPTLNVSAAGYTSQTLTLTNCDPARVELQLLPNARIKKRGRRRGQLIVKPVAPVFPAAKP